VLQGFIHRNESVFYIGVETFAKDSHQYPAELFPLNKTGDVFSGSFKFKYMLSIKQAGNKEVA